MTWIKTKREGVELYVGEANGDPMLAIHGPGYSVNLPLTREQADALAAALRQEPATPDIERAIGMRDP